ncbi:MAG: glucosamine-6-phosphate deaminase [Pirellula sp.]
MRVVILKNADAVAKAAAEESIHRIGLADLDTSAAPLDKPVVIGLATGGTPLGLYREWIQAYRSGQISFANTMSFNLDEYVGLPPEDPRSYHAYMHENLFRHIDIPNGRSFIPKTDVNDLDESAADYEWKIEQAGGIDYQILGIGSDGHIGFNEMGSSLASKTRVKTLTKKTRLDNARYFDSFEAVPSMAITMGIGTIMSARSILLLATGPGKAKAIRDTVEGPVTAMVPASVLQFHDDVTVMIDEEAAKDLTQREYYLESEANRKRIELAQ